MKKYNHGITEEIAKWAISIDLVTEDEILSFDEADAGLLICCYNMHHNKKCMVYSKMVENASGEQVFDSVLGYPHEDYDSAKAREKAEKEDIMNVEIDE